MTQTQVKSSEKQLKTAELKINKILNKIDTFNLNSSYISKLDVKWKRNISVVFASQSLCSNVSFTVAVLSILIAGGWWTGMVWPSSKNCHLQLPSSASTLFRPPEDCSMCASVTDVVRLANTSAAEFEQYAYSAAPVIVTDATAEWKAVKEFSFKFFAEFYRNGKMGNQINDCFFFAYKSGLHSLQEVFTMGEARANLSGDPWYIGWSTCYDDETRRLREYYNRPYFLPRTAESDMVDWVFMGGPGQGAHMHVDSVKHMSWQAQVRGRKQWHLAPPPECYYRCGWITFTVYPGEILVVDTNRWYHQTSVLPGDISITIGAEYD